MASFIDLSRKSIIKMSRSIFLSKDPPFKFDDSINVTIEDTDTTWEITAGSVYDGDLLYDDDNIYEPD